MMRAKQRSRWTVLAIAIAVLTLALTACGVSESGVWGAPEPIPDALVGHGSVAFAGDGSALAAWTEGRNGQPRLMFAERPAGAGWSAPVTIREGGRWSISGPQLTVNGRGDAALTFSLVARQSTVLMGTYRPAGGVWEEPQVLAPADRGERGPVGAVGERGEVLLTWPEFDLRAGGLGFSRREAGGTWSDPGRIPLPGLHLNPSLALARNGRAYLLSMGVDGSGRPRPTLLVGGPGGEWTVFAELPDGAGREGAAALAVDEAGRPAVAWFRGTQRESALLVSRLEADGNWSTPRTLDRGSQSWVGEVEATMTDQGIVVAWSRWSRPGREVSVKAATIREGRPITVSAAVDTFEIPEARGAAAGSRPPETMLRLADGDRPALLWDRPTEARPRYQASLMTSRYQGGAWTPPEPVTDGPISALPAAIHSGEGADVVLWRELPPGSGGPARIVAAERATE
jgi:hypothetical protein